jgi:hypothetical protein
MNFDVLFQVEESRKLAIEKGIEPPTTIDEYVSQRRR